VRSFWRQFSGEFALPGIGRRDFHTASNWTESALAVIAAWKGRGTIVPAFLVGAVAMNHLLLLGVCFIHGGHYSSEIKYPVLMTPIHTRTLPAGLALSTYAAFSTARSGGKSHSRPICRQWILILMYSRTRGKHTNSCCHGCVVVAAFYRPPCLCMSVTLHLFATGARFI
jgi:hypothetical protein